MNPVSATSAPSAPDIGDATLGSGFGLLIFRLARASAWRLGRSLADSGLRWTEFAVLHHLEAQGPSPSEIWRWRFASSPPTSSACSTSSRAAGC